MEKLCTIEETEGESFTPESLQQAKEWLLATAQSAQLKQKGGQRYLLLNFSGDFALTPADAWILYCELSALTGSKTETFEAFHRASQSLSVPKFRQTLWNM